MWDDRVYHRGPAFHGVGSGVYVRRGTDWVEVLEHETVISRVFISAEQFFAEHSPLLLNVRREGIALTVYDPA